MSQENPIQIQDIAFDGGGRARVLTLQRTDALNALSWRLVQELKAALETTTEQIESDPASVRCLIVQGSGSAFCVGADLKERAGMSGEEVRSFLQLMKGTFEQLSGLPVPTIALLNGYALGGGLELALACDIRLAVSDFPKKEFLGLPETSLGIIPGAGGTQRLSRIIGVARAKELIFTARRLSAEEALELGLVHSVFPTQELFGQGKLLAERIARNAPLALRAAKQAIDQGYSLPLSEALDLEQQCYEITLASEDRLEALRAFQEKRLPEFRGH